MSSSYQKAASAECPADMIAARDLRLAAKTFDSWCVDFIQSPSVGTSNRVGARSGE